MVDLTLSPMIAMTLFVIGCVCGVQYRRVWKGDGPRWQLWVFGLGAASCLLTVGFVPVYPTG